MRDLWSESFKKKAGEFTSVISVLRKPLGLIGETKRYLNCLWNWVSEQVIKVTDECRYWGDIGEWGHILYCELPEP
jgi:hypothetical protein